MMKSTYLRAFVLSLILLLTASHPALAREPVTVFLDDLPLTFDTEPVIEGGRVLVPFRGLAEALGVEVEWDGVTRTVLARGFGRQVSLPIGVREALVDGKSVPLDTAPVIREGRTLVPLRFFSEAFGAEVVWDEDTRTVSVTSPPADMYTLGFYAIQAFGQRHLIPRFDAVAFGWARLTGEGELVLDGRDFYWPLPAGEITPEMLLAEAAEAGTTRYLMVFAGDVEGELTRLLTSRAHVRRAVTEITALALEKEFDGVMVDFEGLGLTDTGEQLQAVRESFTRFMAALAEELRPLGKRVAAALHPLNSEFKGYDYAGIARYVDEMIIMAYGYTPERRPEPLYRVQEAVALALERVPVEQLILGISTWSETAESIVAKIGLARRYGLKGIALWRLGLISAGQWRELEGRVNLKGEPHLVQRD